MSLLSKLSIAVIIPDFDYGGEEKRATFFVNNYVEHFKEVYLIAPDGESSANLDKRVKHIKVKVRDPLSVFKVASIVKQHNISFLQGHKRATLPHLYFVERFTNAKCTFNFDNLYLTGNKLYSYIAPRYVLYLSDTLRNFYFKYHKNRVNKTINMGGEFFRRFSPTERNSARKALGIENEFIILSLGRLSPQKNQQLLVSALEHIDKGGIKLLIAGTGPLEAELKQKIDESGLRDITTFLGHRTDIENILNAADVLVQSSIFEGFPNVFIEAASIGLPIVATNVGSSDTIVSKNGLLVDSGDATGLQRAITTMMEEHAKFKKIAIDFSEGEEIKQFTKTVMLKNYLEFYQNLSNQ